MAQEKWLLDGPKTIDIENIRRLKVGLVGGHVDIVGHDEPGVRVEVHSVTGRELLVQVDGDRLEIDHPQLRWDNWIDVFKNFGSSIKAEVSVLVPRSVAVTLGVVSAEALVAGLEADVQLNNQHGLGGCDRIRRRHQVRRRRRLERGHARRLGDSGCRGRQHGVGRRYAALRT